MAIAKIQTGDTVKVTAGNYKGTVGQVVRIVKKKKGALEVKRAIVSTVPKLTKYRKSYKAYSMPGMKYEKDRAVDVSNLTLLTEKDEPSKVKIEISKEGKKTRVLKKTGKVVEKKEVLKADKVLDKKEDKKEKAEA
jgi:large subunit ribosomal protein L24